MRFGDVLEAADQLSLDEQATLVEVLNRRIVEHRRDDLALEIQQARQAFEAGEARPATPEQILKAFSRETTSAAAEHPDILAPLFAGQGISHLQG